MTDTGINIQHDGEILILRDTAFSENRNLCLVLMDELGEVYSKVAVNVRRMNDNEFVLNHDIEEYLFEPEMHNLKGSSTLYQDADNVLILARKRANDRSSDEEKARYVATKFITKKARSDNDYWKECV